MHVLPYSDYLIDLYGNVLVTSADLTKHNPDLARRFATALMQGLRYAVDHPEEAGDILHRHQPTTDAAPAAAELELMRPYVVPGQPAAAGAFDPSRVARSVATMQAAALIPAFVDPRTFVDFTILPGATQPTITKAEVAR
ncbi:MAG TPA: ABC transporter substrate-binding protein [Micromonospora sp.]|nr:ABC transporter substrate-binding protein [Micromonospora sp.]